MERTNTEASVSLNRAIDNLQGKLKNKFLNGYPHYIMPGYNLNIEPNIENYDEDNIMNLFKEFPYNFDLPKPLLPPARLPQCVLRNSDPALELLTIKSEIEDNINRITDFYVKHKRDLKACHKKNLKWRKKDKKKAETSLPRYVAKLAEIIESDPDSHFEGEYNWYFTGGSLDHLMFNGQHILLFPFAEELIAAPITEKSKSLWKPNLGNAAKCDLGSTVFEIRHTIRSDNTYRILGRKKYCCSLYTLYEKENKLELNEIHQQLSDLPYISADLSPIDSNKYCLANSDKCVELWDLTRIKYLSSKSIPKSKTPTDNWISIKFNQADPNLIVYVDRSSLYYIDLRSPSDGPTLILCLKDDIEICESISVNAASKYNSFYQYLGTYHSLLLCDIRFGNSRVVQKWTHQFKSPPLFCNTVNRNDEEVISLSSQLSGENSIILNNWTSDTNAYSYTLPIMPLSALETLKACQAEGKCLDPSLRTRLELCNIGTTFNVNAENNVTLFTQNSIGDIFYQCITHDKMFDNISERNKTSLLAMEAWEKAYLKQQKTVKPLCVSEKANMKHIFNGMKNVNQHFEYREPEIRDWEPRWFQSMEKLGSYIDLLAPELLSMWEIREDTVPTVVTPHQKVLSWLEKKVPSQILSQSQDLTQSQETSVTFNDSNEIYSQELISVSQNIQPKYNSFPDVQIVHDIPASQQTQKRVTQKKKYIAGF